MRKYLFNILLTLLTAMAFSLSLNTFAAIDSVYDMQTKIVKMETLKNKDFDSYISKNELIGVRQQKFDILNAKYKKEISLIIDGFNKNIEQINMMETVPNNVNFDKTLLTEKIYKESNSTIINLDLKTAEYLRNVKGILPSITFQRYSKNFCDFYNNLKISDKQMVIK